MTDRNLFPQPDPPKPDELKNTMILLKAKGDGMSVGLDVFMDLNDIDSLLPKEKRE